MASSNARSTTDARSDAELLMAVAARDREAFRALYERYRIAAFNLALRLAGPSRAEDAFQEALLRIWRSARNFRADGNARGWMLRIVARESLKRLERSRKHERVASLDAPESPGANKAAQRFKEQAMDASAEHRELLDGLNKELDALPDSARRMVLLHYAVGLTQAEIARELAMSASTVSYQLDKAIKTLRANLAQAGLAAAAPLLCSDGLTEALSIGTAEPRALLTELEAKLAKATKATSEGSARAATTGKLGAVSIAVTVAIAGAVAWTYYSHKSTVAPETDVDIASLVQPTESAPNRVGEGYEIGHSLVESKIGPDGKTSFLNARWDFSRGPVKDLAPSEGNWEWKPAVGDLPAGMHATGPFLGESSGPQVRLLLPIQCSAAPHLVTIHSTVIDHKTTHHTSTTWASKDWSPTSGFPKAEAWARVTHQIGRKYITRAYLHDRFAKMEAGNVVGSVLRYETPYPADHIIVGIRNLVVERIEVRMLKYDEIPSTLRDGESMIREILNDPERLWPLPGTAPGDDDRSFQKN